MEGGQAVTREQAREAAVDTADIDYQIGVMQAFKSGKQIEFRFRDMSEDAWQAVVDPKWNWHLVEYRIKPDPMSLLTELVEQWSDESRKLRERANAQKQQYGTHNSVYLSLDTQSRTLGTCSNELLKCIRRVKEAK